MPLHLVYLFQHSHFCFNFPFRFLCSLNLPLLFTNSLYLFAMVLSTSQLVIKHSNSTFSLTITSMTSCLDPCYLVFLFVKWSKSGPHFPYRHVQALSPHHSSYHFWTFTLFVKHYVLQVLLFFCKNILFTFASHDISYLLELVMRIVSVLWFYWESYWCSLDIMNDLPPSYFFHSLCDSFMTYCLVWIISYELRRS